MLETHGRLHIQQEELHAGRVIRGGMQAHLIVAVSHGRTIHVTSTMEDAEAHGRFSVRCSRLFTEQLYFMD
jgi:hypothetical protein